MAEQKIVENKKSFDANKRKGFLSGVGVLTMSALIVKAIGLFYKIPLLSYLGTEGMGYFNTAYELYALFSIISSAGLPVAMSVVISGGMGNGKEIEPSAVYRVARRIFVGLGLVCSCIMLVFASEFAALLGNTGAEKCMRAIAPTVLFICLSSAYRGYFQGHKNMTPTAVSQVIEASGKLLLGLLLAIYASKKGYTLPTVAAYAVLGLVLGTALSVVYLFFAKRSADKKLCMDATPQNVGGGRIVKLLLSIAFPVTLGCVVTGASKFIDMWMILSRLQDLGYTEALANSMYGCYSTLVVPIFNILPTLTASVALSAVPNLSEALSRGRNGASQLKKTSYTAMLLIFAVAIPGTLGLSVFSEDILRLIFSFEEDAVRQAAPWLGVMAMATLPSCMIALTNAMLQAMGKAKTAVFTMLGGICVKIVLSYVLVGYEALGVLGVTVAAVVCDLLVAALNLCFVSFGCGEMLPTPKKLVTMLALPLFSSGVAVLIVLWLRGKLLADLSPSVGAVLEIILVALIYGALMLIFKNKLVYTEDIKNESVRKQRREDKEIA